MVPLKWPWTMVLLELVPPSIWKIHYLRKQDHVGLWSVLYQLPTTTPRGEFSGSLLLPLEGMGVLYLCSDVWEWVFPKAFPKKNGIWEWLLLCSWSVSTFGMGQASWQAQHRLIIVYNTLSSVLTLRLLMSYIYIYIYSWCF